MHRTVRASGPNVKLNRQPTAGSAREAQEMYKIIAVLLVQLLKKCEFCNFIPLTDLKTLINQLIYSMEAFKFAVFAEKNLLEHKT